MDVQPIGAADFHHDGKTGIPGSNQGPEAEWTIGWRGKRDSPIAALPAACVVRMQRAADAAAMDVLPKSGASTTAVVQDMG